MGIKLIELSEKNIFEFKVREIDTWPYLPKGLIPNEQDKEAISNKDMERIQREYTSAFSEIEKVIKDIVNRQRTIVSWLLAVAIGITGNFLANLFFDALSFQLSIMSLSLLVFGLVLLGILTISLFLYYPTNLSYRIKFIPPFEYPSRFHPVLEEDKLNLKARFYSLYEHAFKRDITKFANVISLAILRDALSSVKSQVIKVDELQKLSPYQPFYLITFELKSRRLFWTPKIANKVRSELLKINSVILQAKISIGVWSTDRNDGNWRNRGHEFLNEIAGWDMNNVMKKIESQIIS